MPLSDLLPSYALDQGLDTLQTPELLLVATLRLWVASRIDPDGDLPDWRSGLEGAGLPPTVGEAFDDLLTVLAREALRRIDVRCPCCPRLGGDEAWFLELTSLLQRRQNDRALPIVLDWLPPAAARFALLPAMVIAAALDEAGLALPWRHGRMAAPGSAPSRTLCGHADPGFALVQ